MPTIHSKQLLDHFSDRLSAEYADYCKRHKIQEGTNDFITFLIDKSLLGTSTIRRFTIIKEFEDLYPKNQCHKTKTVKELADKFHLSERAVWSIIKHNSKQ